MQSRPPSTRLAARPRTRAGDRPLDRRDRRAAADGPDPRRARRSRRGALGRRRRGRRRGDPHHRHAREDRGRRTAAGFTVGGMAKGLGDDPSQPRHDARRRDDRLPARAGRGDRLPAADGRRSASTRSPSTANARRTTPSCCSPPARREIERTPATDAAFAAALRAVCAELSHEIVADGEGATLLAEISVSGAASDDEAKAIAQRIATSPLVKTALFGRDANWGRVLMAAGSAPFNGGYAQLEPALVSLAYNGTRGARRRRAARTSSRPSTARPARSSSTSGSAAARPAT